jgi:hypothetical protein
MFLVGNYRDLCESLLVMRVMDQRGPVAFQENSAHSDISGAERESLEGRRSAMEIQPEPPIFVVAAEDRDQFPLIFAAGTQADLDDYLREHAKSRPEGGIRVTSRFFDRTGRRWSYEGGGSSGGTLVPTEDRVSQQYLQDIVTRGCEDFARLDLRSRGVGDADVAHFDLRSRDFGEVVNAYLADEYGSTIELPPPPPTPGSRRHRRWHAARGIPITASH